MDLNALAELKTMRVLCVAGDALSRAELEERLRPWVGGLDLAGDGQAGLASFALARHDIVVTALRLPGMNGLVMSAEIRKLAPGQPIMVLSEPDDTEALYRCLSLGIDHYLTKPVGTERLLEQMGGLVRDILHQREQQRARWLLGQYRQLVEASTLVCTLDTAGRITYANDRLSRLTGLARHGLLGMPIQRLRHLDVKPQRWEAIWEGVLSGRSWSGTVKQPTRDGRMLVLESTLVPILDEACRVEQVFSLDRHVTELHHRNALLTQALGHSERTRREQGLQLAAYKRALDLGASVCVVDPDGRVRDVNHQFASRLGYDEYEMHGLPLGHFAPHCDLGGARSGAASTPASQVLAMRHKDGAARWFSTVFVSLRDTTHRPASLILVGQDITDSLELSRELMDTQRDLLLLVSQVVENRSLETGGHVRRVGEVAHLLASRYGLDPERAEMLRLSAPLHDVGKVGIPDAILHKAGRLDAAEYEVMKAHASMGYEILRHIDRPLVRMAALVAHEHHERFDGLGYPRGLQGEAISIEGRIVALADVLDALSHDRSYKSAWSDDAIRSHLLEERGRKFDPLLVDLALAGWEDIVAIRERYREA